MQKKNHASSYVKYVGVFIDENLNWKTHRNGISAKLIKGNAMLSKLRHFVNKYIWHRCLLFHWHLAYLCLVWGQTKFSLNRITSLQKRSIRILHLGYYPLGYLFHRHKVLKFADLLTSGNCIFVNKCFNNNASFLFSSPFKLTASSHSYCARSVSNCVILKGVYNTMPHGNKSIIISTVSTWNRFQTIFYG